MTKIVSFSTLTRYNANMGNQTRHTHPSTWRYQAQQILLLLLLLLAVFAAVMLIIVAFMINAPLFIIMALLVILLSTTVLMGLVNTPPVTLGDDGLRIHPFIGKERRIAWNDVTSLTHYPLLPSPEQEVLKRYLVGRKKYRAAEGMLLVVPTLPFPYRIAGFLAGQNGKPIITFTNRTHTDYQILKQRLERYAAHAVVQEATTEE